MNAAMRMDETMRELVLQRFREFEAELGPKLLREFIVELVGRWQKADRLLAPVSEADIDRLAAQLQQAVRADPCRRPGPGGRQPARSSRSPRSWRRRRRWNSIPSCSPPSSTRCTTAYLAVTNVLGCRAADAVHQMFDFIEKQRDKHWREQVRQLDHEIFDRAVAAYDRYAIEELHKLADEKGLWAEKTDDAAEQEQLKTLRAELDAAWSPHLFLLEESPRTICSRKWTAWCRCPAGPISGPSRSSTASTCWPPACGP